MSKLTSTPWFVDFSAHKAHGHCRVMGDMCTPVATVFNTVDAKLIAAAPELLEALEACDEAMAYMSEYDIPLCLPDKVKAAIAKAKGEL